MTFTDEKLAELEALAAAATPGPLVTDADEPIAAETYAEVCVEDDYGSHTVATWMRCADARLLVTARSSILALIVALREAWAAHTDARKLLGEAWKVHDEVCEQRDALRSEVETHRRLITALLSGNNALRDQLEASGRAAEQIRAEMAKLAADMEVYKPSDGYWYEQMLKLLAVAPNHVSSSFVMGERKVEIVFYQEGGKTPGEVAAELRAEVERMRPVVESAREIAFVCRDGGVGRAAFMLESFAAIVDSYERGLADTGSSGGKAGGK
jgi:hypothetical protein